MVEQINMQVFKTLKTEDKLNNLANKLNEVINALNVGVVHDNKVQADRDNLQMQADIVESVVDEYSTVIGG